MTEYVPAKVWTWDAESGGTFARINRPIAGATHEKPLPVGKHPLQLYSWPRPMGRRSRSCWKSCWPWGTAAPNTMPG